MAGCCKEQITLAGQFPFSDAGNRMPMAKKRDAAEDEECSNCSLGERQLCPGVPSVVRLLEHMLVAVGDTPGEPCHCLKSRVPPKQLWHWSLQSEAGKLGEQTFPHTTAATLCGSLQAQCCWQSHF